MLIADRHTLAGLYPYMLWTTPGNQETKVMLIADTQTLARLYPYMLWTTSGNQDTNVMLIADTQTLTRLNLVQHDFSPQKKQYHTYFSPTRGDCTDPSGTSMNTGPWWSFPTLRSPKLSYADILSLNNGPG